MGDEGQGQAYWYYWWLRVEYYMTRTGMVQEQAQELTMISIDWLQRQLLAASVASLDLVQDPDGRVVADQDGQG